MPIYEYKCNSCGKKFEKIEKFSDPPLKTHEECGGPVERLISAPSFQFKGTGWYVTDYGKSNGGNAGANGADAKKESSSESKSENTKSGDSKSSDSTASSSTTPAPSTSSSSTADKK